MRAALLVAIAFVVAFSCGLLWAAHRGLNWCRLVTAELQDANLPWFDVGRERRAFDLSGERRLTIENAFGDVEVVPGGPLVTVEAVKRARGQDLAEARRRGSKLAISGLRDRKGGLRVTAGQVGSSINATIDLKVEAPPDTVLAIESKAGEMCVRGMQGAVRVENGVGSVVMEDLPGPIEVRNRLGEVQLRSIRSDEVAIRMDVGEISVHMAEPFSGRLSAHTRIGSVTVALHPGSQCTVVTDVGLGEISDNLPPEVVSRTGPGLIEAGVGVGEVCLTEAPQEEPIEPSSGIEADVTETGAGMGPAGASSRRARAGRR
jgi:hypothetical protein